MQQLDFIIAEQKKLMANKAPMHIALLVSKHAISFCAVAAYNNQIVQYKVFPHQEGGADGSSMHAIADLSSKYNIGSCTIAIADKRYSLVPKQIITESNLSAIIGAMHIVERNDLAMLQSFSWQSFAGVHIIKNSTQVAFHSWQKDAMLCNAYLCLLSAYISASDMHKEILFVYAEKEIVTITALKDGQIVLHNSYQITSHQDILFYVLQTKRVLAFNTEKINLHGEEAIALKTYFAEHFVEASLQELPNGYIYPTNLTVHQKAQLFSQIAILKYANH
jgi:hypothetical protein